MAASTACKAAAEPNAAKPWCSEGLVHRAVPIGIDLDQGSAVRLHRHPHQSIHAGRRIGFLDFDDARSRGAVEGARNRRGRFGRAGTGPFDGGHVELAGFRLLVQIRSGFGRELAGEIGFYPGRIGSAASALPRRGADNNHAIRRLGSR